MAAVGTRRPSDPLVAAAEANACLYCVPVVRFEEPIGDHRWVVAVYHRERCPVWLRVVADTTGEVVLQWAADFEARMAALGYRVGSGVPDYVPDDLNR